MTAFQEVLYTVALFGLFLIVIPVGLFTAGLAINYIKRRRKNHERKSEVHHSV